MGYSEGSLIILTADHGENMMDHDRWFLHGYHVFEEIIRVPLAILGPGFVPARVSMPVSLLDIAPTILRCGGAAVPEGLDGIALTPRPPLRNIFAEAVGGDEHQWRCVIRSFSKWVNVPST